MNPTLSLLTAILIAAPIAGAAPTLTQFTVSPSTVDVSAGGQWVTLHLEAEDPIGVDRFGAGFDVPGRGLGLQVGQSNRIAGDAQAGTYERELFIPAFLPPGDYPAEVTAFDTANTFVNYPGDAPFPAGSATALTVVNTGPVDSSPPVLTSIAFDPPALEPSSEPQTITVTITASDDASGVSHGGITFFGAEGNYFTQGSFGPLDRIAGDALEGTYAFEVTLPSVPEGPFAFGSDLSVIDSGELRALYGDLGVADPYPAGSGPLRVLDRAAPVLESFTVTPASVDVSGGAQSVTLTAVVSDPGGVNDIYVRIGGSDRSLEWGLREFHRSAGDAFSGTYERVVQIPAQLPPGDFPVTVAPRDTAGNRRTHRADAEPFPAGSTAALAVINTGPVDPAPPVLEALAFDTPVLAPGDSPATFTVTLSASDAGAGLTGGGVTFWIGNEYLAAYSFTDAERIAGDTASATYSFEVTLPRIPEGALTADVILRDASEQYSLWGDRPGRAPYPPGTVLPVVSSDPVESYDHWATGYPTLPEGARGFGDDPDRDGFSNGLEFLFGGDPVRFDRNIGFVFLDDPDRVTAWAVIAPENLALGSVNSVTFGAEWSTDGANWQPVPLAEAEGDLRVYHQPKAGARRMFLRFSADLPE